MAGQGPGEADQNTIRSNSPVFDALQMGCAESRETTVAEPFLSNFDGQDSESMPMPLRMGQPPIPVPSGTHPSLATQHERLILELLPLKDIRQFHEWLNSSYVRGSWHEFLRDFLSRNPLVPEPDKAKMAQQAKDKINSRDPKYLTYHPDKDGWTAEDHHIRFLVIVITDNMLKGMWSESDWKKRSIEISKATYEVLSFLRATWKAPVDPPSYDG